MHKLWNEKLVSCNPFNISEDCPLAYGSASHRDIVSSDQENHRKGPHTKVMLKKWGYLPALRFLLLKDEDGLRKPCVSFPLCFYR